MKLIFTILFLIISIPSFALNNLSNSVSGKAKCWGTNFYGQLGNGKNSGNGNPNVTPLDVQGLSTGVVEISGGSQHACALLIDGSVKCWGFNHFGQLGNTQNSGNDKPNDNPVAVQQLNGKAISISSGSFHTCALMDSGVVKCWGLNSYGQLGNPMYSGTSTNIDFPLIVDLSGKRSISISSGGNHTCALLEDHTIKCWGSNQYGQLGNGLNSGKRSPNHLPQDVIDLNVNPLAISAGDDHTCVTVDDGSVRCWGINEYGQLGNPSNQGDRVPNYTPLDVQYLNSSVSAISSGGYHTCALLMNGGIECWGRNTSGELGTFINNGNYKPNSTPDFVQNLYGNISGIFVGTGHTCAVFKNGAMKCWGANTNGELGNTANVQTINPNPYPLDVQTLSDNVLKMMEHGYGQFTCAIVRN